MTNLVADPASGWERPPGELRLAGDGVDVWLVSLAGASASGVPGEPGKAGPDRRAGRLQSVDEQRKLARLWLRALLARYAGVRAEELQIARETGQKPSLDGSGHEWLRFNLSHSGEHALLAVARAREVGVDLQLVTGRQPDRVAEHFFAAAEVDHLRTLSEERRRQCFTTLWARKEALAKATGAGLDEELLALDVFGGGLPGWTVSDLPVGPSYAAALAVEGGPVEIRLIALAPGALLPETICA